MGLSNPCDAPLMLARPLSWEPHRNPTEGGADDRPLLVPMSAMKRLNLSNTGKLNPLLSADLQKCQSFHLLFKQGPSFCHMGDS